MPRATDNTFPVDESGSLSQSARRFLAEQVRLYAGGDVRIQISRPVRSKSANRYLWGVVYKAIQQAMADAGMPASSEAIHEHFKHKYLQARVYEAFGMTYVCQPTSTDLDADEFYEFIERIRTDEEVQALGVWFDEPADKYRSYRISEPA